MLSVLSIAKICHETNRIYCESIGDHTQSMWDFSPEWQRSSAIKGVEFHLRGDHGPEASHEYWLTEKVSNGWKYGPDKDPEKKEHPCIVPYSDLPVEQRLKDHLFCAIVHSFKDCK